jgi:hypothetical protein
VISRYAAQTFARVHREQFRIAIVDAFDLERHGEREAFERVKVQLWCCRM